MNGKHFATLGVMACLGLFACNVLEKPSGVKEKEEPPNTGHATVRLPRISKDFRPDSSRDTSGAFLIQITVSGPGMDPMHDAVILRSTDTEPLELIGIPVGETRIFSARLLWLDPTRGDSTATHEGADTVSIAAGRSADVMLHLRRIEATGNARICVIVEGVTPDSACRQSILPDSQGNGGDPDATCWNVTHKLVNGTQRTGKLRLTRTPTADTGRFEWSGYPIMPVTNGSVPVVASTLYLFGIMTSEMANDGHGIDYTIHYKAKIAASGDSLEHGAVYRHAGSGDFITDDAFGTWGGHRASCVDSVPKARTGKIEPYLLIQE